MFVRGKHLFNSIYKRKQYLCPNNDIHYLAREIDEWLTVGVASLKAGVYNPRHLTRYYFKNEMVEQFHISDRILQNILLAQLKPTLSHIVNPNCLHIYGPSGVKIATKRIQGALNSQSFNYVIRADIKSYYKSVQHHILIEDIKINFDDKKVISMLTNIIKNPIDTPWGTKNPDHGLPLRGPLSQLFSALYLKPLDDAFNNADVEYLRYQDDIIILCKTKRQLNRCKQKMMHILHQRRLLLSRKKSRIGLVSGGFHFLGVSYLEPQPQDKINANSFLGVKNKISVGKVCLAKQAKNAIKAHPHSRTFRKAREQVKSMVTYGFDTQSIRSYLSLWCSWWSNSVDNWSYQKMLEWFVNTTHQECVQLIAKALLDEYKITLQSMSKAALGQEAALVQETPEVR